LHQLSAKKDTVSGRKAGLFVLCQVESALFVWSGGGLNGRAKRMVL
jgi:hypothetical protein